MTTKISVPLCSVAIGRDLVAILCVRLSLQWTTKNKKVSEQHHVIHSGQSSEFIAILLLLGVS